MLHILLYKDLWEALINVTLLFLATKKQNKSNMEKAQHLRILFWKLLFQPNKTTIIASIGNRTHVNCFSGRQLCSPLYHRRFDVEMRLKNNVNFSWNLDRANIGMVNQPLCEIPLSSDYLPGPTNDPLFVLVSFVINFLFSFFFI